jgi:competence ComEA-like helix-hairpin-helix protein
MIEREEIMRYHPIRIALIAGFLIIAITCGIIASGAANSYALGAAKSPHAMSLQSARTGQLRLMAKPPVFAKITIKIALPKPILIKFDGNGGKANKTWKIVFKNKKFGTLPTAKRTNYTFKGWFTAKTGGKRITENSVVTLSRTKTYYAHWAKGVAYGPPVPSVTEQKVNINTASNTRLQAITGVGPKVADAIIAYRNAHGPFSRIEELMDVKGIGKAKFEKMKNQVTV